jgi:septal ring factor EnvC (AmiA/AmiB activator)
LERQINELEEENERYVDEISQLKTSLDKQKAEYGDLRTKLHETRMYKEREDHLIVEVTNLKNELK